VEGRIRVDVAGTDDAGDHVAGVDNNGGADNYRGTVAGDV
jgi:hypothetical protein